LGTSPFLCPKPPSWAQIRLYLTLSALPERPTKSLLRSRNRHVRASARTGIAPRRSPVRARLAPLFLAARKPGHRGYEPGGIRARQGSAAAGILAGMDGSRQRPYRDREDSRFYRTGNLSSEETWQALTRELARVLADARKAFWRHRLLIDPERIRWWHGAIFGRHFPHDGGSFRREPAYFGVMMPDGGMRQIGGSTPDTVTRREQREILS
jgi:hypothetical protein